MNLGNALSGIKPVTQIVGILCIISAALKLFSVAHLGPGSPSEDALIGIGLLHV